MSHFLLQIFTALCTSCSKSFSSFETSRLRSQNVAFSFCQLSSGTAGVFCPYIALFFGKGGGVVWNCSEVCFDDGLIIQVRFFKHICTFCSLWFWRFFVGFCSYSTGVTFLFSYIDKAASQQDLRIEVVVTFFSRRQMHSMHCVVL